MMQQTAEGAGGHPQANPRKRGYGGGIPAAKRPSHQQTPTQTLHTLCQVRGATGYQSKMVTDPLNPGNQSCSTSVTLHGSQYAGQGSGPTKETARDTASLQILQQVFPGVPQDQWRSHIENEKTGKNKKDRRQVGGAAGGGGRGRGLLVTDASVPDFNTCPPSRLLHWLVLSHNGQAPKGYPQQSPEGGVAFGVECHVDTYTYTALGSGSDPEKAKEAAAENILNQMYPSYNFQQIRGFVTEEYSTWAASVSSETNSNPQAVAAGGMAAGGPVAGGGGAAPVGGAGGGGGSSNPPTIVSNPGDKNMVSLLHEVCAIYGTSAPTVVSDQCNSQHGATMVLQVNFMGYTYTGNGKGRNKQESKLSAATEILSQLYPNYTAQDIAESLKAESNARREQKAASGGGDRGRGGRRGGRGRGARGGGRGGRGRGVGGIGPSATVQEQFGATGAPQAGPGQQQAPQQQWGQAAWAPQAW